MDDHRIKEPGKRSNILKMDDYKKRTQRQDDSLQAVRQKLGNVTQIDEVRKRNPQDRERKGA